MPVQFDAIIIGAGQAGPPLAGRLTAAGQRVAMIERKLFGGTCVNTGCIPTKTLVASAYAARLAARAAEYGVIINGPVSVDMKAVKARKDAVSAKSRNGVENWLRGMENCTVYHEPATFVSAREVRVGAEVLTAERIFINVGGRAYIPDLPGVRQTPYLTNSTILELDTLPRHLAVVGGGYIGLEFAQMYRRFGSEVTIVERGPRLLPREDEDVSNAVKEILENEGIHVRVKSECIHVSRRGSDVAVGVDCVSGEPQVIASHLLMAVGRTPNTDDLSLDKAGVEVDQRGYIKVDDRLQTNVPGIWAMGDCHGRGGFTHTSYNDFEIVAANLLDDEDRSLDQRILAYNVYIDPPLGRAGLTEAEVRKAGKPALIATMPMSRVGRALEKGETQGFMKALVDAETKQILGASILGTSGDEAIHCILDVMYAKAPYTTITHAVHIHPTVSELIPTLFGSLKPLQ